MSTPTLDELFNRRRILDSVLDHIGGTPLIRLNHIPQSLGIEAEILVKCEFFNAGGSVKDRIAKRMIEGLEQDGKISKGYTLIEPTSGNTGIGLALVSAVKGYRSLITLPEKMSQEKVDILKALGADIIRTPTEAAWDAPDSHIGVANRLNAEIKTSIIPDQYRNMNNPLAHYHGTAEEIYEQCSGKIDVFVASAGTGGTLSGTSQKLKEKLPGIRTIGVDPNGSILARPESVNKEGLHGYVIEGIGYDFVPEVLGYHNVDQWVKTDDKESFLMARRLIKEEGLLCGGSSGAAVAGALKIAKDLKKGDRVVVVLPDSIRNYMTKHLNDDWMIGHGYTDKITDKAEAERVSQWKGATIKDLKLPQAISISIDRTNKEAIKIMKANAFDQLPVTFKDSEKLAGLVTMGNILAKVGSARVKVSDTVEGSMFFFKKEDHDFTEITVNTPLESLSKFFETNSAAVVTEQRDGDLHVIHVVSKIDLVEYLIHLNQ